jgi:hypothetical protein
MIGITVSTNYAKILEKILSQNQRFFDTWLIVTSKDDTETQRVIADAGYKHVIPLFFDFKAGGHAFNKGGAIRFAQLQIPNFAVVSPDDPRVLILDSDIYLPDALMDVLPKSIPHTHIYGVSQRNDYYSLDHFVRRIVDKKYIGATKADEYLHFVGFFQLYNRCSGHMYTDSASCAECDMNFAKMFTHKVVISGLEVDHLGRDGVHWKGRAGYHDFIV